VKVVVELVDAVVEFVLLPGRGRLGVPYVKEEVVAILDGVVVLVGRGYLQTLQRREGTSVCVDEDAICKVVVDLDETGKGVGETG
jgi:hypothetical protein